MRKKLLILTKSNKKRHDGSYGKCIAGITREPDGKYKWVRLVADSSGDSILDSDFPYNPLDIIEADLYPCPHSNHIENCTYDYVSKKQTISIEQLKDIFRRMPHSFFGSMASRYDGVPNHSLAILLAYDIRIYWEDGNGYKRQRMDFRMGNNTARGISMTDPKHYTNKNNNEEKRIPLAICVASLPDEPVYNKFIASIFPIDSYGPNY